MKYYFVGIKGSGMAGLALIMKDLGNEVVGADVDKELFTQDNLLSKGIIIESLDNMNYQDSDVIVLGNAFINKYQFDKKEIITYQELLSCVCDKYYSIAVCGTHGKTTITNMIKHVLANVDNVSYLVGDGQGKACKDSKYFVFEACEHRDHFLNYFPSMIVCDNVEYDHVEYFKSVRQYKASFNNFFNRAKDTLILNGNIKHKGKAITYGNKKSNIQVDNVVYKSEGIYFDLLIDNQIHKNLFVPFYGKHMLSNTLACIACCYKLNVDIPIIIKSLQTYSSAKRRYNKTIIGSNVIIDDYGHHPSEIKATVEAIKQEFKDKELIIFYHPDRPKRLTTFLYKYEAIFKKASVTYVLPFLTNGKEEANALISIVDNKKIKLYQESKLKNKYENTVFLFTGSKDMNLLINKLINRL